MVGYEHQETRALGKAGQRQDAGGRHDSDEVLKEEIREGGAV